MPHGSVEDGETYSRILDSEKGQTMEDLERNLALAKINAGELTKATMKTYEEGFKGHLKEGGMPDLGRRNDVWDVDHKKYDREKDTIRLKSTADDMERSARYRSNEKGEGLGLQDQTVEQSTGPENAEDTGDPMYDLSSLFGPQQTTESRQKAEGFRDDGYFSDEEDSQSPISRTGSTAGVRRQRGSTGRYTDRQGYNSPEDQAIDTRYGEPNYDDTGASRSGRSQRYDTEASLHPLSRSPSRTNNSYPSERSSRGRSHSRDSAYGTEDESEYDHHRPFDRESDGTYRPLPLNTRYQNRASSLPPSSRRQGSSQPGGRSRSPSRSTRDTFERSQSLSPSRTLRDTRESGYSPVRRPSNRPRQMGVGSRMRSSTPGTETRRRRGGPTFRDGDDATYPESDTVY